MKQLKMKIIMSITGILLAVTMIASASYAWLTISVTPEIQRITITVTPNGKEVPFELSIDYDDVKYVEEDATWMTELHLDVEMADYNLRPISTVDGKHWYLPKFSADGNVIDFREVPLDKVANKTKTQEAETAAENYLVYADVYVRTRNRDKNQDMILSNPVLKNISAGENHFGNYVLWEPEWVDGKLVDNDAMASVRIGFQYTDLNADGTEKSGQPDNFYIFEPNADMRSTDFGQYLKDTVNIANGVEEMTDQIYVKKNASDTQHQVGQYAANFANNKQYYATWAPKYVSAGSCELVNVASVLGQRLVVQETSSWMDGLQENQTITSRSIKHIGTLHHAGAGDSFTNIPDTSSREELTTVEYGTIQKMRIFIWIEGQDIDCWNQVAGGNIYANFEVMGRAAGSPAQKTQE